MVNPTPLPEVLLVENDLFFSARVVSVLEKVGYGVTVVTTRAKAESEVSTGRHGLVVLNLASSALGGTELIQFIKSSSPATKVIAFLSHTKIPAVRDDVMAAGADKLVANSAVSMRLPDIVRDALAGAGPPEED